MLAKPTAADAVAGMGEGAKGTAEQVSYGENFSPARAKGFTLGLLSVFPSIEAMEEGEVKTTVESDSVAVIDYVVPAID